MKNEEEPVHRGADCLSAQADIYGHGDAGDLPQARDRGADFLSLAKQICGNAAKRPQTAQAVRRGKRQTQKAGGEPESG